MPFMRLTHYIYGAGVACDVALNRINRPQNSDRRTAGPQKLTLVLRVLVQAAVLATLVSCQMLSILLLTKKNSVALTGL